MKAVAIVLGVILTLAVVSLLVWVIWNLYLTFNIQAIKALTVPIAAEGIYTRRG